MGEGSKARGVGWVCVYQIPYNPRVGPHITYETLSSISEVTIFLPLQPSGGGELICFKIIL